MTGRKWLLAALVVGLASTLVLVACSTKTSNSGTSTGAEKTPIKIGAVLALTGG